MENWEFAGWGTSQKITNLGKDEVEFRQLGVHREDANKLGPWRSTAICGNDITSSCLYVSSLSILAAGIYAPIALLLVSLVLYLFRKIYGEVGSALPLNGGTYTLLLNTTNKKFAASAACLTLLSYMATAVISANEAMHYLAQIVPLPSVVAATVVLLGIFAFLNFIGIGESANVALAIFAFHILILTLLVIFCGISFWDSPQILTENWSLRQSFTPSIGKALYLGFAAAMLGISGFESSANFIEEQTERSFPLTLRNMWVAISIFNPLLCFLALAILPIGEVEHSKNNLLSVMALHSSGNLLKNLVSLDAVLVLSGAVLTSYVGVTGLVRRMSLDRCLPQWFLRENEWRKTNHWIIISFFIFCVAVLFISEGEVESLAGVYTLSFLSVMMLFAVGNLLLKMKRGRLPRQEKAKVVSVLFSIFAVFIGLSGNMTERNLTIFVEFMGVVLGSVMLMLFRVRILKLILVGTKSLVDRFRGLETAFRSRISQWIQQINAQQIVFFSEGDDIVSLNAAALYVLQNEQTSHLTVVHVYREDKDIPPHLAEHLQTIDKIYPQLQVNFLAVQGEFGPELIERLSRKLEIPKNYMFIGTPGDHFPYQISDLGGVRLVLG